MGKKTKTEWSEKKIQAILCSEFLSKQTKKYEIFNLFVYDWESDYIAITNADYVYECEIKISRADFFNDKKKENKHLLLENKEDCSIHSKHNKPNYFYYAVPENLIKEEEVPEYAGLIYVTSYGGNNFGGLRIIKKAPKLIEGPSEVDCLNLEKKFYYLAQNWRCKYMVNDVDKLKNHIKQLEKDIAYYDKRLSELESENYDLSEKVKKLEFNKINDIIKL